VNDTRSVHSHNSFCEANGETNEFIACKWAGAGNSFSETPTRHIVSDHVGAGRIDIRSYVLGSANPTDSAASFYLTTKPDPEVRVVCQFGPNELDGDGLTGGTLAQVDDTHAP